MVNKPGMAQVGAPLKVKKTSQVLQIWKRTHCENFIKIPVPKNSPRDTHKTRKRLFILLETSKNIFSKKEIFR